MQRNAKWSFGCATVVVVAGCMSNGSKHHGSRPDPSWEVVGFGGYFFKAENPAAVRAWYRDNLRFEPDVDGTVRFWSRDDGYPEVRTYAVWGPFPWGTRYFEPSDKPFMFNFKVRNLDAMLADLRARGVTVDENIEEYEYGRFAWIMDPEGNRIELWEPVPGWTP